ncbi:MAG: hypothetical protein MUF49_28645 [Oculatellaceae cyanobacterium Prado106]|nr:hypothetical protein [Oculatellaceae cyanobacterium Prado106]
MGFEPPEAESGQNEPDPSQIYQHQEVSVRGWGQSLLGSLIACFFGLLLFLGSFVLLFANEGSTDFSKVAKSAQVITATAPNPQAQGKFVAVTGAIATPQLLGDNLYLKPGAYVVLARTVEMFA